VQTPRLFKTSSFRLTAIYGLVSAVSFGLLLLIIYWTVTAALRDQIRVRVEEDLHALIVDAANDGVASTAQDINERLKRPGVPPGYYFLAGPDGTKLAGNLDGVDEKENWQEFNFDVGKDIKPRPVEDIDHQLWGEGRVLPDGSFLLVAQDAFRVLSAQEAIIVTFFWSAGAALLITALIGVALSQGLLRRVDAINRTSRAIMDGHLKERIPVRGSFDELDRLSHNLNRLFDSNQALLESLKQVSTNIAHDLRTPLSRLRQGLEETRIKPGSSGSYERAIDNAIADADQLLVTFAALLRIAQIESGSRRSGFRLVALDSLVERIIGAYRPVAEDQGKSISAEVTKGATLMGDKELLLQMIANLVENAIRHTPVGTSIKLGLERAATGSKLTVADSGPGIPTYMREKVFERFFRLDTSRSTPGNGLGLSLVAAVAQLHDIPVTLSDNHPGLLVTLDLPISPD
jgi:signal transduction histidine kinase